MQNAIQNSGWIEFSTGNDPGAERGQVSDVETSSRTDWSSLLLTQLALPQPFLIQHSFFQLPYRQCPNFLVGVAE